jgi:serine/threonine protein kinase
VDNRRELIEFVQQIAGSPELRSKYDEVVPLDEDGGKGFFSIVFLAKRGKKRIVLKFCGPWADEYRTRGFHREYNILSKLRGQNGIVTINGDLEKIPIDVYANGGRIRLRLTLEYFEMERARTDVSSLIYSGKLEGKYLRIITLFGSACRAVQRLHSKRICHRDIKPGNLLVFGYDNVKIGDFGTARELGEGKPGLLENYDFSRGDMCYTAPEMLCVSREYDQGFIDGDIYSLGATLFEMVTGRIYGDYVYSLEYLSKLARVFREIPGNQRNGVFSQLLPSIIESHPTPRLMELTEDIPPSIEKRLETVYRKLTDPRAEVRSRWGFSQTFSEIEIMKRILRWEQKNKASFRAR